MVKVPTAGQEAIKLAFVPRSEFDRTYRNDFAWTFVQLAEGEWVIETRSYAYANASKLRLDYNEAIRIDLDTDLRVPDAYIELLICALTYKLALKYPRMTDEQVNQINHIMGKSYFEKGNYSAAIEKLDKSARNDKSVYGAESAYYSAVASIKLTQYDEAENKVFNIADNFSKYDYWVAKSFIALADVYVAKENYFQAKETLRSVIDNYKGSDLKQEARAKLAEVERKEPKVSHSDGIEPLEP
jgi:tetratricopeptide (TPR) repeat protein